MMTTRRIFIVASTVLGTLASALALGGCGSSGSSGPRHSAHQAGLQQAVVTSIERMVYLESPSASVSNVQCVASSDSAMTCVGYRNGGSRQTTYTVTVDDTTGRYVITSSASKQVESGSESSHPSPAYAGPRPAVLLDGSPVSGIGPQYRSASNSITLTGSVVPTGAPLTISGLAATPATAEYGYRPISVTNGKFTLKLPVGSGENDFQISQGSEVIVTFAVSGGR
jgi:hypothetical protein